MAGKYLKKKPRRKKSGAGTMVLLVFFLGVMAFSGWKLLEIRREYDKGSQTYESLAQSVVTKSEPKEAPKKEQSVTQMEMTVLPQESQQSVPEQPQEAPAVLTVDFEVLQAINKDIVAWISADDGVINYPVVHGSDNEYYLTHLVDGTVNKNGSIFVDFRHEPGFVDRNTFIYGHNMLNGTMFANLSLYGTAGYYDQHRSLELVTPEGSYSLQVFSGYVTPGDSDIYQLTYRDDAEFEAYLEKIRLLSDFTSDVEVTARDRIVTLSTCTYDYEDARYVLHCRLIPMQ